VRELRHMIGLGERGEWRVPVLRTVASRGEGVAELVAALDAHRQWSDGSGERERRRVARAEAEIEAVAVTRLRARIRDAHGAAGLPDLAKTRGGGRAGRLRRGRRAATRPGRTRVAIRRRPGIVGGAG
jgi:LAO/AO transport system kinase